MTLSESDSQVVHRPLWPGTGAGRPAGATAWRSALRASAALTALELLAVTAWTLWFAASYLNLDPDVVPNGREYLSNIQTHHLWTRAASCGWCALWNGSFRGGYPALADPHGSMLHPLVMLTSLAWGVSNGSKLALAGAFLMAGLAQWWLGRAVGLGCVARTWSAAMAVVAGHLGGKMEPGNFGLVLSTAACSLVLPPLLALGQSGSQRAAVALGVTLALAAVAGQAYMQVGLVFLLPLVLLLVAPWGWGSLARTGRRLLLAAAIALLLAAPLLVPLLHFLPQFGKDIDPTFRSVQPFPFIPLNLVIDDAEFYASGSLGMLPFPYLYVIFVGWLPVALAVWGVAALWRTSAPGGADRRQRRVAVFLAGFALLALWQASAVPLIWLARVIPSPGVAAQISGLRFPSVIAGLAVPALLALAGAGLDRLLGGPAPHWPHWPPALAAKLSALPVGRVRQIHRVGIDARWLLALPLLLALSDARAFSRQWVTTVRVDPGVPALLTNLRTPDLQWVNTPFGEQFWIEPALRLGLKLSLGTQGWFWAFREPPEPVAQAHRDDAPPGMTLRTIIGGVPIYAAPAGREYAAVTDAGEGPASGGRTVCAARGVGGDLDVRCDAPRAGVLTVKENRWSGWRAYVDGRPAALRDDRWLAVDLPAGSHTVAFRYRPWDAPLGLLLCSLGMALATYVWCTADRRPGVHAEGVHPQGVHPEV